MTNGTQTDQVENFLNKTQDIPTLDALGPSGEELPRIPFPTAYRLTRQQEDNLIEYACRRLSELEDELGRSSTAETDWYENVDYADVGKKSFMGKRQMYDMLYHNRVEWRPHLLGGIFLDSNLVVPLARRIVRQMVARANNYFFSTDPWFAAYPIGVSDRDMAADIERYTRFKFDQSKQKHVLELAVELAFVRGETVVKTTYETREQYYQQDARVLVDDQGADILDSRGDYILESDLWVPEMETEVDLSTGQPGNSFPTGRTVLKRDGETLKPQQMIFVSKLITRKITHFKGAESRTVYYKDFLCPLNAASVQEADCIVHLADMPVMRLADMYQRKAMLDMSNEASIQATQRAIELIRGMAHESGQPKAAKDQPRPELGEGVGIGATERTEPVVEIAEFHLRYDANGDGIMEDIMLVIDRKNRVPIFYDYTANVTPDGLRPFDVVRVNAVDGRWTGVGAMEMFETSQEIVDLLVNRWNFSHSRAARVDFWSPHNTMEGDFNKNLLLNWGGVFTPKPGKTAKDCLETVVLQDVKHEALKNMFEFFMQMAMNESGVSHANDSQLVGMDSTKLATGIRNIEKSGQEMFALYLSHLEPGLQDIIQRALMLEFANLDQEETFVFFEGDSQSLGMVRPEDVRDMELNVALLLTRYRGEQMLQSSMQAANLTTQFYSQPPEIQARTAPLYRDALKALQINFADEVIAPLPLVAPEGGQPENPAAVAQAARPIPTGKSEPNL